MRQRRRIIRVGQYHGRECSIVAAETDAAARRGANAAVRLPAERSDRPCVRDAAWAEVSRSAGCRGRAVAHWWQIIRSCGIHRFDGARRPDVCDLAGGIAQGVEQLELRPVVFGDRREVRVEVLFQKLERVNDFLWPGDQDQDVAEPGGMLQALETAVKGGDARRRERSACSTRAAADWRSAWAWVMSAATMS